MVQPLEGFQRFLTSFVIGTQTEDVFGKIDLATPKLRDQIIQ
jgi:hypothetical protein